MIQMIISDLDNTLLRTNKSISEYSIALLKKCQAKGIKIAFATARSIQASLRIFEQFLPDIFIGYGGALVSAGKDVIHRFNIPIEMSAKLIDECSSIKDISSIQAINENSAFTNNLKELMAKDSSHYQYTDFSNMKKYTFLKITITAANQTTIEKLAVNYPMLNVLRYTDENLYQFTNRDATKWNAVKAIAKHYNFSTDMLVAFGDDKNDLEMLMRCGTSVAVENAIDEVKSIAGYICEANDKDGVAHWLEEHVL